MFFGRLTRRNMAAAAIVLVALGTLPEVFCCCDVSWGPGGLFGSQALCSLPEAKTCCCCNPKQSDPSDSRQCIQGGCECSFWFVAPPPMNEPQLVGFDHAAAVAFHAVPPARVLLAGLEQPGQCEAQRPPSPTPLSRCALLQTWRI